MVVDMPHDQTGSGCRRNGALGRPVLEEDVFATTIQVDANDVATARDGLQLDATRRRDVTHARPAQPLAGPGAEVWRPGGRCRPDSHHVPTADAKGAAVVVVE